MSRSLVHKHAAAEVLLTDSLAVGPDRFLVAARWPRDHVFFHPGGNGSGDPLLWIETVRQAGIYLSHRYYGVPEGHPFVLVDVGFVIDDPRPPRPAGSALDVVLDVTCRVTARDARRLAASLEAVVYVGGERRGILTTGWQAVDRRRYDVIRRRNGGAPTMSGAGTRPELDEAAVPLLPAAVGRRHGHDVLLAALPGRSGHWQLHLDDSHPVFFDHALDHIPGMALAEAFRQAAALAGARHTAPDPAPRQWALHTGHLVFRSFAELDAPIDVTARRGYEVPGPGDELVFRTEALQQGRPLATATLHGRALPAAGSGHETRTADVRTAEVRTADVRTVFGGAA